MTPEKAAELLVSVLAGHDDPAKVRWALRVIRSCIREDTDKTPRVVTTPGMPAVEDVIPGAKKGRER